MDVFRVGTVAPTMRGLDQRRKSALTDVPPKTQIWRRRRLLPKRVAARSPFRLPGGI